MGIFTVSGSPHVQSKQTTKQIMWNVVLALMPMFLVAIYFFGLDALIVTLTSVFLCVLFEWLIQKFLLKVPTTISDGSAVITGILLAFNLPSNIPLWILAIGCLVSIGIAKMSYGGLGKNPFNPALVGRVFLFISFPSKVAMSSWPLPKPLFGGDTLTNAITGPTPLTMIKSGQEVDLLNMFIGQTGGSLGEVSVIAILLGGLFMLYKKVISWHIPVSFLGTAAIFSLILWLISPDTYMDPFVRLLSGGLMLGAVFMATDMTTSPITHKGQLIFGFGCGVLTILFSTFGPMPEGVSFAILIMNAVTPLIDKAIKPKKFGY
ncbi:MAG: RnfABCDGE type electron transport complex subunit D [Bacteroidales bacterium]|jgi:electron transport complex protein RnfD|nr:RnfABCDGE type electron transport complex subunit D [Bacteroidales bacterium]